MIFNINSNISYQNSGIESAQYNRFKIFRKYHIPFALVTTSFNHDESKIVLDDGVYGLKLLPNEYLNMYSFFQGLVGEVKTRPLTMENYNFGVVDGNGNFDLIFDKTNQVLKLKIDNKLFASISFYQSKPVETQEEIFKLQFKKIIYYDLNNENKQVKCSFFDYRGYHTADFLIDSDGLTVKNKIYYDIDGKQIIQAFNFNNHTSYILNFNNKQKLFKSEIELRNYFFNVLNDNAKEHYTFVIDRANSCEESIVNISNRQNATLVFHIHSLHVNQAKNMNYSPYNFNYEYSLHNLNNFDFVIVATTKQAQDLKNRYPKFANKFITIPVGSVSDKTLLSLPKSMQLRKPYSMLVTSRISDEKHLEDIVFAMVEITKQYPTATFNIYGYSNNDNNYLAKRKIEYLIDKFNLKNNVFINDYTDEVEEIQENSQLYFVTSSSEGFNIALMEAMSYGCVPIVYDNKYANSLVNNSKLVLTNKTPKEIAKVVCELFKNQDYLQKLSFEMHKNCQIFAQKNIAEKWQEIEEVKNK